MARHGVGALLLATPHLATFASGARRVQVAGSGGTVPWVVVAANAPSATVFTTDPDGVPSWMPGSAVEPLYWDRERQLARIRARVEGTTGALACDVFSPALVALAESLGRTLCDAAPVLAAAAGPRSADELALVERALRAARSGVRAARKALEDATAVSGLLGAAAGAMSAAGAGFPLGEGLVWRGGVRLPPAARVSGDDVLTLEWGAYVSGHAGVAGDTLCADDARVAGPRRRWFEALCALGSRCRAGATTADLRAAAVAAGAGQQGLVAHGLGVGIELPLIDLGATDAVPLVAGTVLVLAPVVDGFRATRALVVGDRAHRWLEPAP